MSVEVQVWCGDDEKGPRQLRVPSTTRLAELSAVLIKSLRQSSLSDFTPSKFAHCSWTLCSDPKGPSDGLQRSGSQSSFGGAPRLSFRMRGLQDWSDNRADHHHGNAWKNEM